MEKIIKKIIDIEYQAQAVIDNAAKENEEKKSAQLEVLKERESRIVHDANRKIDQIRAREMKEVDEIISKENALCNAVLDKMIQKDQEMSATWSEQLVTSVLSR